MRRLTSSRSWRSCCSARSRRRRSRSGSRSRRPRRPPPRGRRCPRSTPRSAWTDCGDGFQCATLDGPGRLEGPRRESRSGSRCTRHPRDVAGRAHRLAGGQLRRSRRVGRRLPAPHLGATPGGRARPLRRRELRSRGTGASRPIDCVDDAFLDLSAGVAAVPDTAERLDTLHRYNAQFAAGCTATHRARTRGRSAPATSHATWRRSASRSASRSSTTSATRTAPSSASPTRRCSRATIRSMVLDGPPDYWLTARDYAYQQARGLHGAHSAPSSTGASRPIARWPQPAHRVTCSTQLIARVDQQPLPGVVHPRRRHPRGSAHAEPAPERRCSRCSTTARAGGRSSPTRSPKRCSRAGARASLCDRRPVPRPRIPTAPGTRWSRPTR